MRITSIPPTPVSLASQSLVQPSSGHPLHLKKIARIVALAALGATLLGCRQAPDRSEGVELVMSSDAPSAALHFELRFETPMVGASELGLPATNSPLVINPPLAGVFTWLSPRNGAFVPSEPLALDRHYALSLRPGLRRADGQPARAALHRTVTTPPFHLTASWPKEINANASAEPEMKLVFNAEVRTEDAQRFLCFRDRNWQRIAADVRRGTVEEIGYELGDSDTLRTWAEEYRWATNTSRPARQHSTEPVPNLLIVTPRSALPLGNGWILEVAAGLPAADHSLRLRQKSEVPIGDITPFTVTDASARNLILSGASIRFNFSKQVPESLTNHPADWLQVAPRPTNLTVQAGWRSLVLRGAFQGNTSYSVKLPADLESSEGFRLAGSNSFVLLMPRVAPRLPAVGRQRPPGAAPGQAAGPAHRHPCVARIRQLFCLLRPKTRERPMG